MITGNDGDDVLAGHTGTDTFVFAADFAANGTDAITSFTSGTDKLDISALTTATAITDVSTSGQTFTTVAETVYFYSALDAGGAFAVETEAGVATVLNTALTITDAAVATPAYIIIVDETENNAAIYEWTDTAGGSEITAAELELLGTVQTVIVVGDFIL